MVGPAPAVNQNVVKENENEPAEMGAQHFVHECLERSRGVAQTEGHHHELI